MKKFTISLGLIAMVAILFTNAGCAKTKTTRQLNAVQSQIAVITDELVRLDQDFQNLQQKAQASQQEASAIKAARGTVKIGKLYRTPSGFELPAMDIQSALKNAGYYGGKLDGRIGNETRRAIKSFQKDHNLEADGVVGRQTWGKLKVYLSPVK